MDAGHPISRGPDVAAEAGARMKRPRPSTCLVGVPIGIFLLVGGAGCSAVGFAIGTAVDHKDRVALPVERIAALRPGQDVYLVLSDGLAVAGRFVPAESPDSVSLDCPVERSATSQFYDSIERRTFPRSAVARYEVPRRAYRFGGLFLGASVDATFLAIALHGINNSHFHPADDGKHRARHP